MAKKAKQVVDTKPKPPAPFSNAKPSHCYFISVPIKDLEDTLTVWHAAGFFPLKVNIGYTAGCPAGYVTIYFYAR